MSFPSVFMAFALTNFCITHIPRITSVSRSHNQIGTPPTVRLFAPPFQRCLLLSAQSAQIRARELHIAEKSYRWNTVTAEVSDHPASDRLLALLNLR